jgi:hypothetical protein
MVLLSKKRRILMARTFAIRSLVLAIIAAMLLSIAAGAFAAPRFPEKTEPVSDYADILSSQTVTDLKTFRDNLKNKTGVGLWVTTVHFLDGEEMPKYADSLFRTWNLGEEDLLLVLCAGEESYYTVAGPTLLQRLPEESQQNLLTSYLRADFQEERYDAAISQYIPALANLLGKQYGATVSVSGLFGKAEATPTPAPTLAPSGENWQEYLWQGYDSFSSWFKNEGANVTPNPTMPRRMHNDSDINLGSLFVLAIVFFLLFGFRRRRWGGKPGCMGCGCGPLGWIVAGLGLGSLFENHGRRF